MTQGKIGRASESTMICRHTDEGRTSVPAEEPEQVEDNTSGCRGSIFEGMECPKTTAEAQAKIELLLDCVRWDMKEIMEMLEPMGEMHARRIQERSERHLNEILLNALVLGNN